MLLSKFRSKVGYQVMILGWICFKKWLYATWVFYGIDYSHKHSKRLWKETTEHSGP